MLPDIWGKCAWKFLHLITLGYPLNPTKQIKQDYYDYFQALAYVLPCDKCKYNLAKNIKKYPLTDEALSSRKNLVKWGIDLHNIVNTHTGKPILSYHDAIQELNNICNPKPETQDISRYIILVLAIAIVIYIIYINRKN